MDMTLLNPLNALFKSSTNVLNSEANVKKLMSGTSDDHHRDQAMLALILCHRVSVLRKLDLIHQARTTETFSERF